LNSISAEDKEQELKRFGIFVKFSQFRVILWLSIKRKLEKKNVILVLSYHSIGHRYFQGHSPGENPTPTIS
jgi:protoheme ferro-lyase